MIGYAHRTDAAIALADKVHRQRIIVIGVGLVMSAIVIRRANKDAINPPAFLNHAATPDPPLPTSSETEIDAPTGMGQIHDSVQLFVRIPLPEVSGPPEVHRRQRAGLAALPGRVASQGAAVPAASRICTNY